MPSAVPPWNFGPFALDSTNACLWRGAEAVALPSKTLGDVLIDTVVGKEGKNPFRIVSQPGCRPIVEHPFHIRGRHDTPL